MNATILSTSYALHPDRATYGGLDKCRMHVIRFPVRDGFFDVDNYMARIRQKALTWLRNVSENVEA